jgi:potassium channel subfamily K
VPSYIADTLTKVTQPDYPASLILSSVGLGFNVLANVLLIIRFSVGEKWRRTATRVSTICWDTKVKSYDSHHMTTVGSLKLQTAVAIVNLITFGLLSRNGRGYSYLEGFWCAIVSVIISGIIAGILTIHCKHFPSFSILQLTYVK